MKKVNMPWSPQPERDYVPESPYSVKTTVASRKSSNSFMDAMEETISSVYDLTLTENGAVVHKTTGSKLLDMNFAVASLRGKSDAEIYTKFREAFNENPIFAMRWLFYARDVRQGLGERNLFRVCVKDLANHNHNLVNALIPLFAEYGRWDDMFHLIDTKCKVTVLSTIKAQWDKDLAITKENNDKPISLLAKWIPSEQATNKNMKRLAHIISTYLKLTPRQYRKSLSAMRKKIDVVERKMSSNNWQAIDYETVPSLANLRYKNAFLKHDNERREVFLSALKKGEAKINSSVAYPHDIAHKYRTSKFWAEYKKEEDVALEAMWKSLPDMVKDNSSTIVVADGSGSMTVNVGNSSVEAIDVANSLAIYFAERCYGAFKNKYITFSRTPKIVNLGEGSLLSKLKIAARHTEVADTNIEAVFDLILATAKRKNMKQEEIPERVLIISDMEFNECVVANSQNYWNVYPTNTLFDEIKKKYNEAGYKLPHLIFWNVNSRTKGIPVTENELGVTLVSGFSINVCKSVMTDKVDPYEALIEAISDKRYDAIEDTILKTIG